MGNHFDKTGASSDNSFIAKIIRLWKQRKNHDSASIRSSLGANDTNLTHQQVLARMEYRDSYIESLTYYDEDDSEDLEYDYSEHDLDYIYERQPTGSVTYYEYDSDGNEHRVSREHFFYGENINTNMAPTNGLGNSSSTSSAGSSSIPRGYKDNGETFELIEETAKMLAEYFRKNPELDHFDFWISADVAEQLTCRSNNKAYNSMKLTVNKREASIPITTYHNDTCPKAEKMKAEMSGTFYEFKIPLEFGVQEHTSSEIVLGCKISNDGKLILNKEDETEGGTQCTCFSSGIGATDDASEQSGINPGIESSQPMVALLPQEPSSSSLSYSLENTTAAVSTSAASDRIDCFFCTGFLDTQSQNYFSFMNTVCCGQEIYHTECINSYKLSLKQCLIVGDKRTPFDTSEICKVLNALKRYLLNDLAKL
ncbi:hypothetical protein H4219_004232 [Mycoemilia scoparia]|uniref:Uncharacterized protein n=1 Tax=Mycoemilia scoparia TaxID=417184 RepID=A0A9W7ZY07_9FUNG|nr:hypothetical protein H4219_004232 [Mycoemilia scoparia]